MEDVPREHKVRDISHCRKQAGNWLQRGTENHVIRWLSSTPEHEAMRNWKSQGGRDPGSGQHQESVGAEYQGRSEHRGAQQCLCYYQWSTHFELEHRQCKVRKGMERAPKLMGRLLTKVLLIPTTTMQSRNYHPHNTEARTKVQRGYLVLP